jgi:hypothetical protein
MSLTTHLSLVSPDRNALLDVVEEAESAFFEYGLAPDIGGVRELNNTEATPARTVRSDDERPDHFSPELVAEITQCGVDRVHYVAVCGLPVIERVVREEVSGRSSVVVQANVHSGSGPGYRVYRYDRADDAYEVVSALDR